MRKPDCVLVRLGEAALKSPQVQKKFFEILMQNIKAALGENYKIEVNPNRIFVYGDAERIVPALKKVFGITSLSPAWTCFSGLSEIKLMAVDIAEQVLKLNPKNSFAIRARRSGRHKFSSQTIAEEVGAAIKRVTGAKVNLSKPEKEIFIECRSRKTYIFTKKIRCEGGLPLGTSGKVVIPMASENYGVAAWLMMKRGCEIIMIANKSNSKKFEKMINGIKKWHIGREMKITVAHDIYKTALESGNPIATGETADKKMKKTHAFRPIFFLSKKEINDIAKKIKSI